MRFSCKQMCRRGGTVPWQNNGRICMTVYDFTPSALLATKLWRRRRHEEEEKVTNYSLEKLPNKILDIFHSATQMTMKWNENTA